MTDEEELQEEGIEAEAAHAPPVSGDPEENPEGLEEHLEEVWEGPAAEEGESPVAIGEPQEAEGEAFEPPEDEPETEREAVQDLMDEPEVPVVEDEDEAAIAEVAEELEDGAEEEPEAEEDERVPDLDELSEALAEAREQEMEEALELGEEGEEDGRAWYVIHCYSGQENKVRHNLEQRIETMGMKDEIFDVVVPTEEEIEVKDGKRRTVERRVFPGYILVQMLLTEDSWYVVRNTPGVTGFVGMGN
jgi:hypothetical protein